MIDPNFTNIKFNNFPEHYIHKLKDIAWEVLDEGILGDNPTYINPSKNIRFIIKNFSHIPFEINGINFFVNYLITTPNAGMWYTHVDLGREFALNIPIQVNLDKGYVLVCKDGDYSKLGKLLDDVSEVTPEIEEIAKNRWGVSDDDFEEYVKSGKIMKIWINAKESDFEKIYIDKPMILNSQIPHSWVNYDNRFRVVASLSSYENFNDILDGLKQFI